MSSIEFEWQKKNLEYRIGQCQSVINSVIASAEMPEERKQAYLDYERPRLANLQSQLEELRRNYYGSYYGFVSTGASVGE